MANSTWIFGVVCLALVGFSNGFTSAPLFPALRNARSGIQNCCLRRERVALPLATMQAGDDDKPIIAFNPNEGWKADHQKEKDVNNDIGGDLPSLNKFANSDVGDFFVDENGNEVERTLPKDNDMLRDEAARKEGAGGRAKLQELLTTNVDVTEFKRQTYTKTLTRMGGFHAHAWKIDGTHTSGDPTFALKFNTVAETKSQVWIEPNAMTYEDFLAGWTDDSAPGWEVTPTKGTLDRRGGEDTQFQIEYKGPQPEVPLEGTLVILLPNDNYQWTFKFLVSPPGA
eukprot:CAMPEP_0181325550 /NCGR_PEP_ID=MMETSP1101-20121128/20993_1 /TAXON_ID=46948 /ORGANISM="Rhodomonas abbreviata, Strain Caron Lab Isolate" /LENGTH=283 /DNA_ID=CAMNT_0023433881 /DNA_START=20 /DNA_END=871 /DNA_ORIENTATION=+